MKKSTISAFLLFAAFFNYAQTISRLPNSVQNPCVEEYLERIKILEKDTSFDESLTSPLPICNDEKSLNVIQYFPYPIIFLHGLNGSADTWFTFYENALSQGWSYGGHLMYNLNYDQDDFYSTIASDVHDFTGNLQPADFYLMNFYVTTDGVSLGDGPSSLSNFSNQSAIVKQGVALGKAIKKVLQFTGRDKVILVGHSMGGLCAREYLQNPNNWQADGQHHVAKLLTTGTPHGGSNTSGSILSNLLFGINEKSEAIRDLRTSYFYSGFDGVYLFGGYESASVMDDNIFGNFNCYDVNCNGSIGNQITGLNEKDIYTNMDFACITSNINDPDFGCGDLIVGCTEAQLKSYYPTLLSETFEINKQHTNMPKDLKSLYEGFDEPDFYHLSYGIETNTSYNAFITKQGSDASFPTDYDDFVFTTSQPGKLKVHVVGAPIFPFAVSILDADYNYLYDQSFNNGDFYTQEITLPAGTYYLETYANPTESSWQYPYGFNALWTPLNPSASSEEIADFNMSISPNPASDFVEMNVKSAKEIAGNLVVINSIGQVLHSEPVQGYEFKNEIDVSAFAPGVYFSQLRSNDFSKTIRFVVE